MDYETYSLIIIPVYPYPEKYYNLPSLLHHSYAIHVAITAKYGTFLIAYYKYIDWSIRT